MVVQSRGSYSYVAIMLYARQETDKTITLGVVDGDRHRGRPPRWVDDIVDWCGRPLPSFDNH